MTVVNYPVEMHTSPPNDIRTLWKLYQDAFDPLATLAVQRHVMTLGEFEAVCFDNRILKFIVRKAGEPIGMSVLTNRLESWPLISPQYFQHRWPEEYEARQLWYVGFLCTAKGLAGAGVFPQLLETMYPYTCKGKSFMDFCLYNVEQRSIARATRRILQGIDKTVMEQVVDSQYFYMYEFAKEQ